LRQPSQSIWFQRPPVRTEHHLRLFCFPYAGGSAAIYRSWQHKLPPDVIPYAVQLPGRGGRLCDPPFRNLAVCVGALADALLPALRPPFALFGHSMGAVIAFELARLLEHRYRLRPACLFVSGRQAPHLPPNELVSYALPDAELIEELRRLNGTPQEVLANAEVMELLTPALRADFELIQTYMPNSSGPVQCPLHAMGGLQDPTTPPSAIEAWRDYTTGEFTVSLYDGDHFSVLRADAFVATVARMCQSFAAAAPSGPEFHIHARVP
jgi:medium-chain acyl-[acyl-carrier-protein] hydrolase